MPHEFSDPRNHSVTLQSGTLCLRVDAADLLLEELCGFASRRSRKRGFVFVSKVLGKHYPVRPHVMAETYQRLVAKIATPSALHYPPFPPGPVLLLALAETATGLGQGVYESLWQRTGRTDLLFLHSTRYRLRWPLASQFDESHSHATEHLLYEPADAVHAELFHQAQTLILVDDEISTGNTLTNLAVAYRQAHPLLQQVHFVCLTDWLGPALREKMAARLELPLFFHSLLRGTFTFHENPAFDPGVIPDVTGNGQYKDHLLPALSGRLGVRGPIVLSPALLEQVPALSPGSKILMLGTGEFSHAPYRLALWLEQQGHEVWFQSTTRSPLLVERDLASVLEFPDNYHDGITNYLYNVAGRSYDHIVIGYETTALPPAHCLAERLATRALFF